MCYKWKLTVPKYKSCFTLAYLDLDNFKTVNDLYGHATGDEVLCFVVQQIQNDMRKTDLIARLGGDEFALLLSETD
jgi:diguanylate cyclase (GGDEF)-like protein